jgi:hypothetical protein
VSGPGKTTVKLNREVHGKLLALKIAWGKPTLEDVVEELIRRCGEECGKIVEAFEAVREVARRAGKQEEAGGGQGGA